MPASDSIRFIRDPNHRGDTPPRPPTERNPEGLTWREWRGAATGGIGLTPTERDALRLEWKAGVDPTEYRNAFNNAKRGRRAPVVK